MKMIPQVVLLVAAVTVSSATPSTGNLQILSLTPNEVKVSYRTSSDEGVELLSEVHDRLHHVSISTLDGTHLVSVKSSSDTESGILKIMDSTLLLHPSSSSEEGESEDRARIMEYAVPASAAAQVEKELQDSNYISADLLRTLDTSDTTMMKRSAFSKLLSRPEWDTITDMAHAMGAAGILGYENQPALNFYGLAMSYGKMRTPSGAVMNTRERALSQNTEWRDSNGTLTCTFPDGSEVENCERCPTGEYCTGMCGPYCYCWWFACGDCCYHHGCYEHDQCCSGENTYWSMACMLVFPFDCEDYRYDC